MHFVIAYCCSGCGVRDTGVAATEKGFSTKEARNLHDFGACKKWRICAGGPYGRNLEVVQRAGGVRGEVDGCLEIFQHGAHPRNNTL